MSVYKPKGRDTYYYDFVLKGHRYSGNTGQTDKAKAKRRQEDIRTEIRKELGTGSRPGNARMSWGQASDRFWGEVGRFHKGGGDRHTLRALTWLGERIGRHTLIADIRSTTVADLVARRRGEKVETKEGSPLVRPSTVNRSVTEVLRKVLNRARDVWEEPVAKIPWKSHILDEPAERVRELSLDEEERLFESLRPDYKPIALFALASGVRLSGCLKLRWADVDWGNRKVTIRGKGGRDYTIPMSAEMREILFPLQRHDPEIVFTYFAQRNRDGRQRDDVMPITESGLMSEWRRAREDAGILDYRWHDHRHTRATRLLRVSGNLRLVQKLLGHSRIETTARYAHVNDDDLRQALDNETASRRASTPLPVDQSDETKEAK